MEGMDMDHYAVILGLNYGEGATMLSKKDISKAYRLKALELHPDKRPNDPNAHAKFHNLKTSYQILMDDDARKLFHDSLRVKRERDAKREHKESMGRDAAAKRRKMMSDLEARERKFMEEEKERIAKEQEKESIARKLREEVARIKEEVAGIRARYAMETNRVALKKRSVTEGDHGNGNSRLQGKVVKVKWEKVGVNYSAQQLRELFQQIGKVEDVMIRNSMKRGSAIVVMASKDEAVLACNSVLGDLTNPLLIMPTQLSPRLSKLVGIGHTAYEDSVIDKMKKAEQNKYE